MSEPQLELSIPVLTDAIRNAAGSPDAELEALLAELQLKIVWEEILKRFNTIEVVEEPKRVYSSFVKGYETLPVRIAA